MNLIDPSTAPLRQHCDTGCGAVKPLLRKASKATAPLHHCFLLFQKIKLIKMKNIYMGMDSKIDGAVVQFSETRVVICSQVRQGAWRSCYCAMEQYGHGGCL